MAVLARLVPALLAAALLAGCAGGDGGGDAAAGGDGDGSGAGSGTGGLLASATEVAAPEWQAGQWWEWETRFASGTSPDTFRSIVVDEEGSGASVATEQDGMAKEEAAFDHPLLGSIRSSDLGFDGWSESPWSLLRFPLTDGATYTVTLPNIAWDVFLPADSVDATVTATFLDGDGPRRVALRAVSGEHLLAEAVYDSGSGWYESVDFYDVDPGQEGLEVGWRAVAAGANHTGPYFQATAEPVLLWFDGAGFTDDPTAGGQPFADPHPYAEFTVAGGEGHLLFGVVGAEAVAGARAVVLVGPDGNPRVVEAHDAAVEGAGSLLWIDEPALAGQWRIAAAGAGGFSGAFAELYEVTLSERSL